MSSAAGAARLIYQLQRDAGNRAVSGLLRAARAPTVQRQESAPGEAPALVVEDSATQLEPGQQRKTPFLSQVEAAVGTAVGETLGPVEAELTRPQIATQLGDYRAKETRSLEKSILAEVPGAAAARSADAYVPLIVGRVRRELQGEGGTGSLPGPAAAVVDAVAGAASFVTSLVGALFKRRDPASPPRHPGATATLGPGAPLDATVRSGVEHAFREDFSDVRVHTDPGASDAAGRHDARAMAVGRDVLFAPGEYSPGTPIGDALIAHELAHVAQQRDAIEVDSANEPALERDADRAAAGAVTALHAPGAAQTHAATTRPLLRSGLALRSCKRKPTPAPPLTFDQYRDRFNALWSAPPYAATVTTFDPALDSKGPRNPRARAIFNALYVDPQVKGPYDADAAFRERVDTYMGPEGLDLIGSPRLRDLSDVFKSHPAPVPALDYPAFKAAVAAKAAALDPADRLAIERSNEWQRLINTSVTDEAQRAEIREVISPAPAAIAPDVVDAGTPAGPRGTPAQQAHIVASWKPTLKYDDGARQVVWAAGKNVTYHSGAQNLQVGAELAGAETNPGVNFYVRGRVVRGAAVVSAPQVAQFPFDQHQLSPFAMPINAPAAVPAAGDPLTIRVELLRPDRATVLSTKDIALLIRPEVVYTEAQAVAAATADDTHLHDASPTGLLGKTKAKGGAAANVAAAVTSGAIVLRTLTRRHDSAAYVAASPSGPDPGKTGYFVGSTYATSMVLVAGAAGFRLPATGEIVVNRTTDVVAGSKRADDELIMLTVHEAVHKLDVRPAAGTDLERYKTEFRAYWTDGRYDKLATSYDETLPPPGPKSPRARAIFDKLYGSVTYPFVKPAYDNNTAGFREAVDSYLVPDGINLTASMRLENLRATIDGWGGAGYDAFKAQVEGYMGIGAPPAGGALTADDRAEITRQRAWRDLVERKLTVPAQRAEIKTVLGIPR